MKFLPAALALFAVALSGLLASAAFADDHLPNTGPDPRCYAQAEQAVNAMEQVNHLKTYLNFRSLVASSPELDVCEFGSDPSLPNRSPYYWIHARRSDCLILSVAFNSN